MVSKDHIWVDTWEYDLTSNYYSRNMIHCFLNSTLIKSTINANGSYMVTLINLIIYCPFWNSNMVEIVQLIPWPISVLHILIDQFITSCVFCYLEKFLWFNVVWASQGIFCTKKIRHFVLRFEKKVNYHSYSIIIHVSFGFSYFHLQCLAFIH